jgi:hypothetical protein
MEKRKAITTFALLGFFTVPLLAVDLAHAQETSSSLRKREPAHAQTRRVAETSRKFQIVDEDNNPIPVTFAVCNTTALNSCIYGVDSVDHEESTGNCRYSCLSAPTS